MKKKFVSIIALVLCAAFVFSGSSVSSSAKAQEPINEIEEQSVTEREEKQTTLFEAMLKIADSLLFGGTQTDGIDDKADVRFPFIIAPFQDSPGFLTDIKSWLWIGTEVEVLDYWGNYAYVKCVETEEKGYIHTLCIDDPDPELLIKEYEHVYSGVTKTLTYGYNGAKEVKWSLSKSGIIKCESVESGIRITGLKPGTVELTVKAGSVEKSLYVHCVYQWKKPWTAVALTSTTVYKGPDESYGARASLAKGTRFVVKGDEGGSDGWAYGQIYNTNTWGFVRIEDVSTKGTVSQYDVLLTLKKIVTNEVENEEVVPWEWPISTVTGKKQGNYISSPYGWRDTSSKMHKGIDITTGDSNKIEGYTIVSAFSGTVDYIASSSGFSTGYCVAIISDDKDPVSGKQYGAIYMHMKSKPLVSRFQKVYAGTPLGYVGNTGNSNGPHLHFEVNNQAASLYEKNNKQYSDPGRDSYDYLINPIFFYMHLGNSVKYNPTSESERNYYGTYWYGNGNKISEAR